METVGLRFQKCRTDACPHSNEVVPQRITEGQNSQSDNAHLIETRQPSVTINHGATERGWGGENLA